MKKHLFNSLRDFYADVRNVVKSEKFSVYENMNDPDWRGLSLAEINLSYFSYPVGVEKLKHYKDVKVEKDLKVKFWSDFDGYDIDIERLHDGLDCLIDTRKVRKLPKTIDIYVNVSEGCQVDYNHMLNKTYAAVKIVDHLESLGVRCAVFACAAFRPKLKTTFSATEYLEVCVKNYQDSVNLGALCTAISPWMLRQHIILWIIGHIRGINWNGIASPERLPSGELSGIIIDNGSCLNLDSANRFIETIKVA